MAGNRLDLLDLVVSDVPTSRAFYERLGIEFGDSSDPYWANHHVDGTVPVGATELNIHLDSRSFTSQWNAGWHGGTGVVLGLKVASRQAVDDLVVELEADGVAVQQPPYDAMWGARYAVISDPDGNSIGIMSPVDPDMRSAPPDPE